MLIAIMFGVGELVTHVNVGVWQRINSAFGIPWLLVIAIWLMRRDGKSRWNSAVRAWRLAAALDVG